MASKVLTALQEKVLIALFDNGLADRGYYLTGGTALSEFYLQHRYSDDLDLFTRKLGPLREDCENFNELLLSLGLIVVSQSITELSQFFGPLAEELIQRLRPRGG